MPLPKILSIRQVGVPTSPGRRRAVAPVVAVSKALNMTMEQQQQDNWCWAAVSVSVKRFYTASDPITQCEQANAQLGQTTCCVNGSSTACNQTGYLKKALSGLGILQTVSSGTLPFASVESEIDQQRPVGCRIDWMNGSAHFVCIDGYNSAFPAQLLTIKDPFWGVSLVPYAVFATAYQGIGKWTDSFTTKP